MQHERRSLPWDTAWKRCPFISPPSFRLHDTCRKNTRITARQRHEGDTTVGSPLIIRLMYGSTPQTGRYNKMTAAQTSPASLRTHRTERWADTCRCWVMLWNEKHIEGELPPTHQPPSSAIMYSLSLSEWKSFMSDKCTPPPPFHQLSWPSWSRHDGVHYHDNGGNDGRGEERNRLGVVGGGVCGVKSVQLSHEDRDFWRPPRTVGGIC